MSKSRSRACSRSRGEGRSNRSMDFRMSRAVWASGWRKNTGLSPGPSPARAGGGPARAASAASRAIRAAARRRSVGLLDKVPPAAVDLVQRRAVDLLHGVRRGNALLEAPHESRELLRVEVHE